MVTDDFAHSIYIYDFDKNRVSLIATPKCSFLASVRVFPDFVKEKVMLLGPIKVDGLKEVESGPVRPVLENLDSDMHMEDWMIGDSDGESRCSV